MNNYIFIRVDENLELKLVTDSNLFIFQMKKLGLREASLLHSL